MNTLFVGQQFIKLERVDSTNRYAQDMAKNGLLHEGAVISAFEQYLGKGQRGSSWQTVAGKNITLSVYLKPRFLNTQQQFLLSQCIALALYDCISHYCKTSVFIKWPNDILINDKKAAGILIENSIKNNVIDYSIVGIGLNVNQTEFENLPQATSLQIQCGKELNLEEVTTLLCQCIEKRYFQLKKNSSSIHKSYIEHLYRFNTNANYIYQKEKISARIMDVQADGKLVLQKEYGEKIICDLKELEFVFN